MNVNWREEKRREVIEMSKNRINDDDCDMVIMR
jgi:hypothetical protein